MGWWGYGIMEGDPPYDFEAEIEGLCGASYRKGVELTAGLLEAAEDKIADYVTRNPGYGAETGVPAQVWGVLLMRHGAPMPDKVRKIVLQGIDAALPMSTEWRNPDERVAALEAFRAQVLAYPAEGGVETDVPSKPLFQTLYEGLHER